MSVRWILFAFLAFFAAGGVVLLALAVREPASAAGPLPHRLVVAQLAADSGPGGVAVPGITPVRATATATGTATPTATPEIVPEPEPTYTPSDPYYPYPY